MLIILKKGMKTKDSMAIDLSLHVEGQGEHFFQGTKRNKKLSKGDTEDSSHKGTEHGSLVLSKLFLPRKITITRAILTKLYITKTSHHLWHHLFECFELGGKIQIL